jgi:CubicO group peptidase (beta-lactamase class C family)
MAATRNGVLHQGAFGSREAGTDQPVLVDTIFRIASMTKPVTSVAVMQLVEQGQVALDASVADYLPELAHLKVLDGFDEEEMPKLRDAVRPPTIRELLSNTSGYAYGMWNEDIRRFARQNLWGIESRRERIIQMILASDPGTRWEYGPGTTILGLVVEQVSGLTLEVYFHRHIFSPLGMHDTFYQVPAEKWNRVASMHLRQTEDNRVTPEPNDPEPPQISFFPGEGELYSTGPDYLRFVRALLSGGELDTARILNAESVELMGRNQIGEFRAGEMTTANPTITNDVHLFPGATNKFGFGFLINARPVPGGRDAGSLMWGGLFNTYFWIDRQKGVGGVVLTQLLPFADTEVLQLVDDYERAVYALPR